jgi:hypothetical protein
VSNEIETKQVSILNKQEIETFFSYQDITDSSKAQLFGSSLYVMA